MSFLGGPRRRALVTTSIVAVYAACVAWLAFDRTHGVVLVNDGEIYMEMAKQMAARGSFEVPNGLDVVDSRELWTIHTIKLGAHLYAKYPPFYGLLAALPYAWLQIRGMYLLNAVSLVLVVLGYARLARRVLPEAFAFASTVALPFCVPLFPYALMELPHLPGAALLVWALVAWDASLAATGSRRACLLGGAAGLALGVAVGVRVHSFIAAPVLVGLAWLHAARRREATVGLVVPLVACFFALSVINHGRFGVWSPFSYGPPDAVGAPIDIEQARYFLRPGYVATVSALGVLLVVWARARRENLTASLGVSAAVVAVIAILPFARATAAHMAWTTASLIVNPMIATHGAWTDADMTSAWVNKALLESTPFLVLGLLAMAWCAARAKEPLLRAIALLCGGTIVFLSVRDPDPRTLAGVIVGFSLSPRYLAESLPLLFLLAMWSVRGLWPAGRVGACLAAAAALAGAVGARDVLGLFQSFDNDYEPHKRWVLLVGSLGLAALVAATYALARAARAFSPGSRGAMACASLAWLPFVLANGYSAAATVAEDTHALRFIGAYYAWWTDTAARVVPDHSVIVGRGRGKDGVFSIRQSRDVVFVDVEVDDGADVLRVLRAFVATGRPIFYFGLGMETIRDRVAAEFRWVRLVDNPPIWRLDPKWR